MTRITSVPTRQLHKRLGRFAAGLGGVAGTAGGPPSGGTEAPCLRPRHKHQEVGRRWHKSALPVGEPPASRTESGHGHRVGPSARGSRQNRTATVVDVAARCTHRQSHGQRHNRQRITEGIWWYSHSGAHSAEPLRLGKQTLCQLSYSRSVSRSVAASACARRPF